VEGKDIMDGRGPRGPSRAYGKEMAERGYVVIAPDYPRLAIRRNYDFAHSRYASGTMKAISDNMRCADLLLSRANVEPEKAGGHWFLARRAQRAVHGSV
jgi:dienelactone hydrolase